MELPPLELPPTNHLKQSVKAAKPVRNANATSNFDAGAQGTGRIHPFNRDKLVKELQCELKRSIPGIRENLKVNQLRVRKQKNAWKHLLKENGAEIPFIFLTIICLLLVNALSSCPGNIPAILDALLVFGGWLTPIILLSSVSKFPIAEKLTKLKLLMGSLKSLERLPVSYLKRLRYRSSELPSVYLVRRHGHWVPVPLNLLSGGDIIAIEEGSRAPSRVRMLKRSVGGWVSTDITFEQETVVLATADLIGNDSNPANVYSAILDMCGKFILCEVIDTPLVKLVRDFLHTDPEICDSSLRERSIVFDLVKNTMYGLRSLLFAVAVLLTLTRALLRPDSFQVLFLQLAVVIVPLLTLSLPIVECASRMVCVGQLQDVIEQVQKPKKRTLHVDQDERWDEARRRGDFYQFHYGSVFASIAKALNRRIGYDRRIFYLDEDLALRNSTAQVPITRIERNELYEPLLSLLRLPTIARLTSMCCVDDKIVLDPVPCVQEAYLLNGEQKSTVIDILPDPYTRFGVRFQDPNWRTQLASLKPMGLMCLLSTYWQVADISPFSRKYKQREVVVAPQQTNLNLIDKSELGSDVNTRASKQVAPNKLKGESLQGEEDKSSVKGESKYTSESLTTVDDTTSVPGNQQTRVDIKIESSGGSPQSDTDLNIHRLARLVVRRACPDHFRNFALEMGFSSMDINKYKLCQIVYGYVDSSSTSHNAEGPSGRIGRARNFGSSAPALFCSRHMGKPQLLCLVVEDLSKRKELVRVKRKVRGTQDPAAASWHQGRSLHMLCYGHPSLLVPRTAEYWDGESIWPIQSGDRQSMMALHERWTQEDFDSVAFTYAPVPSVLNHLFPRLDGINADGTRNLEPCVQLVLPLNESDKVPPQEHGMQNEVPQARGSPRRVNGQGELPGLDEFKFADNLERIHSRNSTASAAMSETEANDQTFKPADNLERIHSKNAASSEASLETEANDQTIKTADNLERIHSKNAASSEATLEANDETFKPSENLEQIHSSKNAASSEVILEVNAETFKPAENLERIPSSKNTASSDATLETEANAQRIRTVDDLERIHSKNDDSSEATLEANGQAFKPAENLERIHSSKNAASSEIPLERVSNDLVEGVDTENPTLKSSEASTQSFKTENTLKRINSKSSALSELHFETAMADKKYSDKYSHRHHHHSRRKDDHQHSPIRRSIRGEEASIAKGPQQVQAILDSKMRWIHHLLSSQIFAGMLGSQEQPNNAMRLFIEDLRKAGVRFVHFSTREPRRARVVGDKMGLETDWNTSISLRELDDSVDRFEWDVKARLPHGINEIRHHLEHVDEVPLLVSTFTDSTPETTRQMIEIMQENGEKVAAVGNGLFASNYETFRRANVGVSVLPHALPHEPGMVNPSTPFALSLDPNATKPVNTGDGTVPMFNISAMFNSLSCSIVLRNTTNPYALVEIIREARRVFANEQQSLFFMYGAKATLALAALLSLMMSLQGPILSPADVVWILCVQSPLLSIAMLFSGSEGDVMERMPPKHDVGSPVISTAEAKRFRQYGLAQTLPTALCLVVVYTITFLELSSRAFSPGDEDASPGLAREYIFWSSSVAVPADMCSMTLSPCLWHLEACSLGADPGSREAARELALAKKLASVEFTARTVTALAAVYWACFASLTLVNRTESLYRERQVSRVWVATVVLVILLQVLYCEVAAWVYGLGGALGSFQWLLDIPWDAWILLLLWPVGMIAASEVCKTHDRKRFNRYMQKLRLIFDTRLGMYSPK